MIVMSEGEESLQSSVPTTPDSFTPGEEEGFAVESLLNEPLMGSHILEQNGAVVKRELDEDEDDYDNLLDTTKTVIIVTKSDGPKGKILFRSLMDSRKNRHGKIDKIKR